MADGEEAMSQGAMNRCTVVTGGKVFQYGTLKDTTRLSDMAASVVSSPERLPFARNTYGPNERRLAFIAGPYSTSEGADRAFERQLSQVRYDGTGLIRSQGLMAPESYLLAWSPLSLAALHSAVHGYVCLREPNLY